MKIVNLNTTKTVRVIFDDDDSITLISYSMPVITIDADGWLACNGLYSRTTIRHIGQFMRAYTSGNYYDAKACAVNNLVYNIYTGEVRNRA